MKKPLSAKSWGIADKYGHFAARLESLTLRERALVVMAMVAVMWMVWDWTLERALSREVNAAAHELASSNAQLASELTVQQDLLLHEATDPNKLLDEERESIEARIAIDESRLEGLVGRFVSPEEMTSALEDVVTHHRALRLIRLASLPVEPVSLGDGKSEVPGLYRHVLRVEMAGNYFDLLAYLDELEGKPWQFGWRTLDYRVGEYPQATMVMEIETLSRRTSLLGV